MSIKVNKLVIVRERWLRGGEESYSWLLSPSSGKMCCLGFLGKECGISETEMRGVAFPESIESQNNWPPQLLEGGRNSKLAEQLMNVNDTPLREQTREAELISLFAELNIELEFISEVQNG